MNTSSGGRVELEIEDITQLGWHPTCMACTHWAKIPVAICRVFKGVMSYRLKKTRHRQWVAINRELQWGATGAMAALTAILRRNGSYHTYKAYPGCVAWKNTLRIRNTWFHDKNQLHRFPPDRTEYNSINMKSISFWFVRVLRKI